MQSLWKTYLKKRGKDREGQLVLRCKGGSKKGSQSLSAPPSMRQEQKARTVLRDPRGHPLPR